MRRHSSASARAYAYASKWATRQETIICSGAQSSLISDIQRRLTPLLFCSFKTCGWGAYTRPIARVFSGTNNERASESMACLLKEWSRPLALSSILGTPRLARSLGWLRIYQRHTALSHCTSFSPTFSFSLKFDVSRYAAYKWSRVNWYVVLERTAGQ